MNEIAAWALSLSLLIWSAGQVRAIWITRRQPVRRDVPTDVWITPEPRIRRHYDRD